MAGTMEHVWHALDVAVVDGAESVEGMVDIMKSNTDKVSQAFPNRIE